MTTVHIANPEDSNMLEGLDPMRRYLFTFGCVGMSFVLVYDWSIYDALEKAAEYCVDRGWTGHVAPLSSTPEDLGLERGQDPDESLTYTESGWLTSHEWFVDEVGREELMLFADRFVVGGDV